jgi:hypothetical protein
MRRKLFTITSAISLLLCIGVIAAWLWMPWAKNFKFYSPQHEFLFTNLNRYWGLRISGGTRVPGGGFRAPPGQHWDGTWANPTHQLPLGFSYGNSPADDPTAAFFFGIVVPSWSLILLLSLLPCVSLYRWWFHPIRRPGECRRCGYDLTGNTSGTCPECGTPVPKAPAEKSPRPA